jgi:hypothetical protein
LVKGGQRRGAGKGRRGFGLHRRHRHAVDAAVLCGRGETLLRRALVLGPSRWNGSRGASDMAGSCRSRLRTPRQPQTRRTTCEG